MNNADVLKIANTMESLVPEKEKRQHFLSIFLEAVNHANSLGSNKWGVQCVAGEEKVRLLVGSFIVLTIGKGRLWFALDEELLKTKEEVLSLENSDQWEWDKNDYPAYKRVLSRNGYYNPSQNNFELWNKIKDLHFEFITKVANRYGWLLIKSQSKHQPELLLYLRQELRQLVPDPDYKEKGFAEEIATEIVLNTIQKEKLEKAVTEDLEAIQLEEDLFESGEGKKRLTNYYERRPKLRAAAILSQGISCVVCGFNFAEVYGEHGLDYIEVHHKTPVSSLKVKTKVNPKTDMAVLCSNCHRMIHRKKDNILSVEDLKSLVKKQKCKPSS
jgi:predicted HNH restriction endonuclease